MYGIGIDIGSTYTKYCILGDDGQFALKSEKTPIRQSAFFSEKQRSLEEAYPQSRAVSCGYGKQNYGAMRNVNELTALARGADYVGVGRGLILDIGGQDTKLVRQRQGRLEEFFVNEKCAAGSGLFLSNVLHLLDMPFETIDLTGRGKPCITLSSVCAVFAQSELVRCLADNVPAGEIVCAVIWQILKKAETLLAKTDGSELLLSGGLTAIKGFAQFAQLALNKTCSVSPYSRYLSAIGCAALARE